MFALDAFKIFLIAGLLASRWVYAEAELKPQNFSHTAPIQLQDGDAFVASVRVPLWAYLASRHQLRDLRVFNAEGIAVAHRLEPAREEGAVREFRVAQIAVEGDAPNDKITSRDADVQVDLQGKVSIHLSEKPKNGKTVPKKPITQWILDDSQLAASVINHFRFEIADARKEDFSADISIDTSEDLRSWQTVASDQKILNYGKQRISQLGIIIPEAHARYWRVRSNGEDIGRIAKIFASAKPALVEVKDSLTVDCDLNKAKDHILCLFENSPLPATGLHFDFGKQHVGFNAILKTYVQTPDFNTADEKNRPIQILDATLTNPMPADLALNGSAVSGLAVTEQQGGKLGLKNAPKATAYWPAKQLKFYVHGAGPFTLAVGSDALNSSGEQTLSNQGTETGGWVLKAVIQQAQPLREPEKKRPWLLWGILGFAVLTLSAMAVSLLKHK